MWRRVEVSGVDARFFSSLCVFEKWMYVFGGRNIHSFAFNDLLRTSIVSEEDDTEEELLALVGSSDYADVVFVLPDDLAPENEPLPSEGPIPVPAEWKRARRVYAHRAIVCARSPALAAMLSSQMREGRSGVVALAHTSFTQVRFVALRLGRVFVVNSLSVRKGKSFVGVFVHRLSSRRHG